MTEDNPSAPPRKLELSTTQVAGSALAAVSAAFFASWLGTAGTLIGAAVGSVVATVGSTTYTWWLRRTSEAVKRTAAQVRETGMGSTVVVPVLRNRRADGGGEHDAEADAAIQGEDDGDRWAFLRNRPWGKVALVTAGVLLASLGSITVVEAVTGKPISALLRGDKASGVSVTRLLGDDPSSSEAPQQQSSSPTPAPSHSATPNASATPAPSASSTPTPSAAPSASATPSASSTPSPTASATPTPAP